MLSFGWVTALFQLLFTRLFGTGVTALAALVAVLLFFLWDGGRSETGAERIPRSAPAQPLQLSPKPEKKSIVVPVDPPGAGLV